MPQRVYVNHPPGRHLGAFHRYRWHFHLLGGIGGD